MLKQELPKRQPESADLAVPAQRSAAMKLASELRKGDMKKEWEAHADVYKKKTEKQWKELLAEEKKRKSVKEESKAAAAAARKAKAAEARKAKKAEKTQAKREAPAAEEDKKSESDKEE